MKNKALFLDRDGVINVKPPEHDYVKSWKEFSFIPGIDKLISTANKKGFLVFVVSNQRGISRGIVSKETVEEINTKMIEALSLKRAMVEKVYYCPHDISENCLCRKPEPGMILSASKEYNLDLKRSILIGDDSTDIEAGRAAGCRTVYYYSGGKFDMGIFEKVEKRKILMICPFARPNLGGVESHLDKLLDYLSKKNVYVYLLTYQPLSLPIKGEKLEQGINFEIHRFDWFGTGWFNKLENYFPLTFIYLFPGLFIKSFIFFIRRPNTVNCVHAHGFAAAAIAKVIKWFFPVRIVVSTHAVYRFPQRPVLAKIIKWLLSSFDEILAVSDVSKKELEGISLDKAKITVHKNWIDLKRFKSKEREISKKELRITGKNVLFVGRMIEMKGVGFLLNSAKKFPTIKFIFIGDGPMRKFVEEQTNKLKNVFYVGRLSQNNPKEFEKLISYYSAADIFATIPTYDEGFGAVYLETIGCGTPVLCSNKGSLPTFLDESVAKLIIPTQENVNLAIEELLIKKPKILEKMQKNCRKFAEKNFSDKNAGTIYESYGL